MTRAEHLARQARIAAAVQLPQAHDAAVCSLASTLLARYAAELEAALGPSRIQPLLPWQTREWLGARDRRAGRCECSRLSPAAAGALVRPEDAEVVRRAFALIAFAAREAAERLSPARARVTRSMIEGQIHVIAELGFGEEPSDQDIAEVALRAIS